MQLNLNRTQDMKMIYLFLTCPSRPLSTPNSAEEVTHLKILGSWQSSQAGARRCSRGGHTALRGLEAHCQLVNPLRITGNINHELFIKTGHTREIAKPEPQEKVICNFPAITLLSLSYFLFAQWEREENNAKKNKRSVQILLNIPLSCKTRTNPKSLTQVEKHWNIRFKDKSVS